MHYTTTNIYIPIDPPCTYLPQQDQHPELARRVAEVEQHRRGHAPCSPRSAPGQVQRLEVPHDGRRQLVGSVRFFWGGRGEDGGSGLMDNTTPMLHGGRPKHASTQKHTPRTYRRLIAPSTSLLPPWPAPAGTVAEPAAPAPAPALALVVAAAVAK